ncbi:hypothetical protein HYX04_01915 [Candidatus Woesearchaeota archaeon]|nr:hypothetical protein [Candidatus Woesearchaeota archaeon]
MEMLGALGVRSPNARVNIIFGKLSINKPLKEFQKEHKPEYFDDPRFQFFGLDVEGEIEALIFYDRRNKREMGISSSHDLSELIAHYVLKTLPFPISTGKNDIKKELRGILT